jgi:hypothetical protein
MSNHYCISNPCPICMAGKEFPPDRFTFETPSGPFIGDAAADLRDAFIKGYARGQQDRWISPNTIDYSDVVSVFRNVSGVAVMDGGHEFYSYWYEINGKKSREFNDLDWNLTVEPALKEMFAALVPAIARKMSSPPNPEQR